MSFEQDYIKLCRELLSNGKWIKNKRTGRECLTLPEWSFEYTLDNYNAPLFNTRQSFPVSAVAEIIGYLRRYEWATDFDKIGSKTWYVNANETQSWVDNTNRLGENHMGKVYGAALENWEIPELFTKLQKQEDDRGLMINFWRPDKFSKGCLRPCLYSHLFSIIDGKVYLSSSQRSCDVACGLGFNSIQVYFLGMLASHLSGLEGGVAKHHIVNPHIYDSHVEGIEELLARVPEDLDTRFSIKPWVQDYQDVTKSDTHAREYFTLSGYKHQGKIPFDLVA